MPEQDQAPDPAPSNSRYILKFEPSAEFNETELFVKGTVRGKVWISEQTALSMKSLTGEETDKIDDLVKIKPGMSQREYNTLTTYYNLAFAVERIGDKPVDGPVEERVKHFRGMAAPILSRMALAYLEFNGHVDDLFVGKGAQDLAKKS